MATVLISRENDIIRQELRALCREVHEACIQKASFKSREQLIRFENVLRHYATLYDLDDEYFDQLFCMKQKLFSSTEITSIQKTMLEQLRELEIDIKYLSKM